MDSRAAHLVTIGDKLFSDKRTGWDQLCQDIAEQFYPMRSDFTSSLGLGLGFTDDLMDSYPVQARETLGNAPSSMLRQGDWFAVKTGFEELDEDPANARWLEAATSRFRRLVYDRRANFVKATGEVDHDYVAFGNGVVSVEESPTRDHFLFRAWHPRDCAWMLGVTGSVDHLQRRMDMTARNMVRKFKGKVAAEVKTAAENNPSQVFKVRHIVMPMDDIYGDDKAMRRKFRGMPFISMTVDCEHQTILAESPLPVFSYVVPRWRTLSNLPWGFSPATISALPDGRMLQALSAIIMETGEKALDPPMYGRGEIFQDTINRYAGGFTYVDLEADQNIRDAMMQETVGNNFGVGLELKKDARELIAEAFLLNKLMLPNTREMTAFETNARLDEFRRAALPFFGPIEAEYHLPLLDTAFQMAVRNRAFDFSEMPEALADADVTFTFESPLNTAEGRKNVQAFQESVQILAGAAQFDQQIPAMMKFDTMTKDAVRGTGAKADWFNDEETKLSEEDQIAQVQRLQQAASFLREGAGVAADVAGATQAVRQASIA